MNRLLLGLTLMSLVSIPVAHAQEPHSESAQRLQVAAANAAAQLAGLNLDGRRAAVEKVLADLEGQRRQEVEGGDATILDRQITAVNWWLEQGRHSDTEYNTKLSHHDGIIRRTISARVDALQQGDRAKLAEADQQLELLKQQREDLQRSYVSPLSGRWLASGEKTLLERQQRLENYLKSWQEQVGTDPANEQTVSLTQQLGAVKEELKTVGYLQAIIRPLEPEEVAPLSKADENSPKQRDLIEKLKVLDLSAPTAGASSQQIAAYNTDRSQLLAALADASSTEEERLMWLRQRDEQIATASQLDNDPNGPADVPSATNEKVIPAGFRTVPVTLKVLRPEVARQLAKSDSNPGLELRINEFGPAAFLVTPEQVEFATQLGQKLEAVDQSEQERISRSPLRTAFMKGERQSIPTWEEVLVLIKELEAEQGGLKATADGSPELREQLFWQARLIVSQINAIRWWMGGEQRAEIAFQDAVKPIDANLNTLVRHLVGVANADVHARTEREVAKLKQQRDKLKAGHLGKYSLFGFPEAKRIRLRELAQKEAEAELFRTVVDAQHPRVAELVQEIKRIQDEIGHIEQLQGLLGPVGDLDLAASPDKVEATPLAQGPPRPAGQPAAPAAGDSSTLTITLNALPPADAASVVGAMFEFSASPAGPNMIVVKVPAGGDADEVQRLLAELDQKEQARLKENASREEAERASREQIQQKQRQFAESVNTETVLLEEQLRRLWYERASGTVAIPKEQAASLLAQARQLSQKYLAAGLDPKGYAFNDLVRSIQLQLVRDYGEEAKQIGQPESAGGVSDSPGTLPPAEKLQAADSHRDANVPADRDQLANAWNELNALQVELDELIKKNEGTSPRARELRSQIQLGSAELKNRPGLVEKMIEANVRALELYRLHVIAEPGVDNLDEVLRQTDARLKALNDLRGELQKGASPPDTERALLAMSAILEDPDRTLAIFYQDYQNKSAGDKKAAQNKAAAPLELAAIQEQLLKVSEELSALQAQGEGASPKARELQAQFDALQLRMSLFPGYLALMLDQSIQGLRIQRAGELVENDGDENSDRVKKIDRQIQALEKMRAAGTQAPVDLSAQLAMVQQELAEKSRQLEELRNQQWASSAADQIRAELAGEEARLAELRTTYGENHELVRTAQARIDALRKASADAGLANADGLQAEIAKLEAEYDRRRMNYGENHDEVRALKARIDVLRKQTAEGAEKYLVQYDLSDLPVNFMEAMVPLRRLSAVDILNEDSRNAKVHVMGTSAQHEQFVELIRKVRESGGVQSRVFQLQDSAQANAVMPFVRAMLSDAVVAATLVRSKQQEIQVRSDLRVLEQLERSLKALNVLEDGPPNTYQTDPNSRALEAESLQLAQQLQQQPQVPEDQRQKLKELVTKSFEARQAQQQAEIKALQERLRQIQQAVETREQNKQKMIDNRVQELLNPALKWDTSQKLLKEAEKLTASSAPPKDVETSAVEFADPNLLGVWQSIQTSPEETVQQVFTPTRYLAIQQGQVVDSHRLEVQVHADKTRVVSMFDNNGRLVGSGRYTIDRDTLNWMFPDGGDAVFQTFQRISRDLSPELAQLLKDHLPAPQPAQGELPTASNLLAGVWEYVNTIDSFDLLPPGKKVRMVFDETTVTAIADDLRRPDASYYVAAMDDATHGRLRSFKPNQTAAPPMEFIVEGDSLKLGGNGKYLTYRRVSREIPPEFQQQVDDAIVRLALPPAPPPARVPPTRGNARIERPAPVPAAVAYGELDLLALTKQATEFRNKFHEIAARIRSPYVANRRAEFLRDFEALKDEHAAALRIVELQLEKQKSELELARGALEVALSRVQSGTGPQSEVGPAEARVRQATLELEMRAQVYDLFVKAAPTELPNASVAPLNGGFSPQPAPNAELTEADTARIREEAWNRLGLRLEPSQQPVPGYERGGMNVTAIRRGGEAEQNGIRDGDILVGLHNWEVTNDGQLGFVLHQPELPKASPFKFYLVRNGEALWGSIRLEGVPNSAAAPVEGNNDAKSDADAARVASLNNGRKIVLALHNYHDVNNAFPPSAVRGKLGQGGEPHSWRVAILPYLGPEGAALYDMYRFDQPWDSPDNQRLLSRMPAVFRAPQDDPQSANTSWFGLVAAELPAANDPAVTPLIQTPDGFRAGSAQRKWLTMFSNPEGGRFREVTDGLSNTLAIVEASRPIPWTKPEDIPYALDQQVPELGGWHADGFIGGLADGSLRMFSKENPEETLRRLIEINDGQVVRAATVTP